MATADSTAPIRAVSVPALTAPAAGRLAPELARSAPGVALRLLPALRAAAPDTLIIADGYSCAEQIHQTLAREPLHLAQVLAMATGPR